MSFRASNRDAVKRKASGTKHAAPHKTTRSAPETQKVPSQKEEALKQALASAFAHTGEYRSKHLESSESVDSYGKGAPTDRLQFGYSPANSEEAVAFHSRISASAWVQQRRRQGKIALVKKQKLHKPNCEPLSSVLKLKNHWSKLSEFNSDLRGGHVDMQSVDELLDMLAAKQRTGEDYITTA